ncbi:MAG: helix-turn-helix domain-containing protein [Patescibacteria group bacterium]
MLWHRSTLKYNMEDKYLTISEVAKKLRVNKRTVYRLAEKGKIPAFKFGKSWRISSVKLEKLFEERTKK